MMQERRQFNFFLIKVNLHGVKSREIERFYKNGQFKEYFVKFCFETFF